LYPVGIISIILEAIPFHISKLINSPVLPPVLYGYDRYFLLVYCFLIIITLNFKSRVRIIYLLLFLILSLFISSWSLLSKYPYSNEVDTITAKNINNFNLLKTSISSNMIAGNSSVLHGNRDARLTTAFHTCRYRILVELINSGRIWSCDEISHLGNNIYFRKFNRLLFQRIGISTILLPSFSSLKYSHDPISIYDSSQSSYYPYIHIYNAAPEISVIYNWQHCAGLGLNSLSQMLIENSLITIDVNFGDLQSKETHYCLPFAGNSNISAHDYKVLEKRDGFLRVRVYNDLASRLVFRQAWNQNWLVSVDGGANAIPEFADFLFMAGPVLPPGAHQVEFTYSPRNWDLTYFLSIFICTLVIVLIIIVSFSCEIILANFTAFFVLLSYLFMLVSFGRE